MAKTHWLNNRLAAPVRAKDGWAGLLLRKVKQRISTSRREIELDLTSENIEFLWRIQRGLCLLCGDAMLKRSEKVGFATTDIASIDRIDNKQGYMLGNIRLLHWQCNSMRGQWPDNRLYERAILLVKHLKKMKG